MGILKINQLINSWLKLALHLDSFDYQHFKKLKSIEDIFDYANGRLQKSTEDDECGSSRCTFILDYGAGKALKIALPDNLEQGIHQNKSEAEISHNLPEITAQVSDHHPNYYWVETQLARPLNDLEEMMQALNLSDPKDCGLLFGKFPPKNHKLKKKPAEIALIVSKLVNENLLPRDVIKSDSWGYTIPDNKLVLIDYGILKKN